jgi:hypothetical protein
MTCMLAVVFQVSGIGLQHWLPSCISGLHKHVHYLCRFAGWFAWNVLSRADCVRAVCQRSRGVSSVANVRGTPTWATVLFLLLKMLGPEVVATVCTVDMSST